jgi:hypothetical protein
MNQLISAAVGEKLAALLTVDYLQERAPRGSRRAYLDVLAKVPDVEPEERDALPGGGRRRPAQRKVIRRTR